MMGVRSPVRSRTEEELSPEVFALVMATGIVSILRIPALRIVSLSFFWLSLTTWMIVALGVLHNQWRRRCASLMAG